jgi:RNA polymerase sigma factor (sigma-70 family)
MTATNHDLDTDTPSSAGAVPLAELFDAHCGFVWRSLRHLGVDEAALDDAVQDVFVIAYRRWSTFRGDSTPRTWLFGIARRVAWRHRRAAHVHASRQVASAHAPEPAHEPFERVHAIQSLARLLGGLDRDKRAVFVLAELEGLTAPEVSEALGIPLGTAYSRLRAAWRTLGTTAAREELRLRSTLALARAAGPTPERRDRMWAAIAAGLPAVGPMSATGIGAAIAGVTQAHAWTVVIVALALGLGGAVVASSRTDAPADAAPNVPIEAPPRAAHPVDRDDEPSSRRESAVDHDAADRTTSAIAAPDPSAVRDAGRAAPRDVAKRTRPASASPAAPTPDVLAQELALVRAAKRALAEARPADALASLRDHARRFPQGQLAADREALVKAAEEKMQGRAIDLPPGDTSAGEELER